MFLLKQEPKIEGCSGIFQKANVSVSAMFFFCPHPHSLVLVVMYRVLKLASEDLVVFVLRIKRTFRNCRKGKLTVVVSSLASLGRCCAEVYFSKGTDLCLTSSKRVTSTGQRVDQHVHTEQRCGDGGSKEQQFWVQNS